MNLYRQLKYVMVPALLLGLCQIGLTQVAKERKSIIGSWYNEDRSARFEYRTNGECKVTITGEKEGSIFKYKITETMPKCDPGEPPIDPKEKPTFLEMIDKGDRTQLCYEINGITEKTMSLRTLGRGGALLFTRIKK